MSIQLFPFLRRFQHRRPITPQPQAPEKRLRYQRGQSLIIFAIALVGLIAAIGLAVDAGVMYVTYGELKRAVDAAAITAANEFKTGQTIDKLQEAAEEVLVMHELDMSTIDLKVYICDAYDMIDDRDLYEPYGGSPDGTRDRYLQTVEPIFYQRCPNTEGGLQAPRKLVWVEASQLAPMYFMTLLGFNDIRLTTHTVTEAAPVDLVIVIDVSESMGEDTVGFVPADFDPTTCNDTNTCEPLAQAKQAALLLVDKMHEGYDRVAIVTYDTSATTQVIPNIQGVPTSLSDDIGEVKTAIANITLHDDAPFSRLWPQWKSPGLANGSGVPNYFAFNPVNPEDRDGDGHDADPMFPPCVDIDGTVNNHPMCCELDDDRWTEDPKFAAYNWPNNGFPCDSDVVLDAYDWDQNGVYSHVDSEASELFLGNNVTQQSIYNLSPLSTCTGCGIREANNILTQFGRSGAVWIVVFLSDGAVNYAPRAPQIASQYSNSYCFGPPLNDDPDTPTVPLTSPALYSKMWNGMCRDQSPWPRVCIDDNPNTCPPDSTYQDPSTLLYGQILYSPFDYALDQVDDMALTEVMGQEPIGNNIGIFTIGLGAVVKTNVAGDVTESYGEDLLRYMAAVGDDGDRTTDPCDGVDHMTTCGQYYYAPSGEELLPIFEEIATRIYTRISQ